MIIKFNNLLTLLSKLLFYFFADTLRFMPGGKRSYPLLWILMILASGIKVQAGLSEPRF